MMRMVQKHLNRPPFEFIRIENAREGDTYRDCLAENYRDNLPHVSYDAFKPVQFKTLVYICATLIFTGAIFLSFEFQIKQKLKASRRKRKLVAKIIALHRSRSTCSN